MIHHLWDCARLVYNRPCDCGADEIDADELAQLEADDQHYYLKIQVEDEEPI